MTENTAKAAIIDCDQDLMVEVSIALQESIVGKPIFYSDSLADLVKRHCPHLYDVCEQEGYYFIPSNDKNELMEKPPAIWFDIVAMDADKN
jgi:hypothetical protein